MLKKEDIQIRDPFVYVDQKSQKYYLYGSTDKNIWGKGTGFDVYVGEDLENWEGPFPVFRPEDNFYSDENYWAPEVHSYKDRFYMFATFLRKDNGRRGTGLLVSDDLMGPFKPHSQEPVTPKEWNSLDGTLYVDEEGTPWMVFCHEWVQVTDGQICALQLKEDLTGPVGEPILLFRASEAGWPTSFQHRRFPGAENYVTDGPFVVTLPNGELVMLWASFINNVYAQGISRSLTGKLLGPWVHDKEPVYKENGGHGMIFKTFDGDFKLTLHAPNRTPDERPFFLDLGTLENGEIKVK
ncbi:glycoside hydrolase family 43 protein [Pullulanibacillus sp. KACC 23026]|uniref:glycoside hydrolase family 43 protein n=1 Tax=Pullulanibacillus sp. KACC 23026 TaxID=3028315 RepID=UPI0023B04619|nr:glycoside hydrolase family 43 protein [Pullulanibacillus sp. KACC 23026]WEG13496.1 glycoside hydrolase family 43 protein [Pullulanibacillus sp. KACC 23026]